MGTTIELKTENPGFLLGKIHFELLEGNFVEKFEEALVDFF